jgi:hypothetical protein
MSGDRFPLVHSARLMRTIRALTERFMGKGRMETILAAIVEDDRQRVKTLLEEDRALATALVSEPRLYECLHWIYARDTALHLAAAGYRVEIAQLLIDAGADPNSRRNHRASGPLHYAADGRAGGPDWDSERQLQMIELLLRRGAEINAQDKNGATPLHRAVRTRSAAAVKFLLERGADPHIMNKPGSTPFHLAMQNTGRGGSGIDLAKEGQRQIIQLFLAFGLKPRLKDRHGKSVSEWAKSAWVREALKSG